MVILVALASALYPFVPALVEEVMNQLAYTNAKLQCKAYPIEGKIKEVKPLVSRV